MKPRIHRRDFLKLAGLLPISAAAPRFLQKYSGAKNVVIVVFDAFSAYHASLYGYARTTTPNMDKLAERAIVYHRHYASCNYTTTGTASLLSGTQPWIHRAFHYNSKTVNPQQTIFRAFQGYRRIAYTHNILANGLLRHFKNDIDDWIPREELYLASYNKFVPMLFGKDEDAASIGWARSANLGKTEYAYSLLLSRLNAALQKRQNERLSLKFPLGLPSVDADYEFILEDAIDYAAQSLKKSPQPFMAYFHFLPPHDPYNTSSEFVGRFRADGYEPIQKPANPFSAGRDLVWNVLQRKRRAYDEFILYADKEFGRFYKTLEDAGLLENTILVLTSDHGDLQERGISGHNTEAMHEPILRVPLLIFDPERKTRLDIHAPTSAIDLLPTLTQLAGLPIPDWSEGRVLPPYAEEDPQRSIYALRAFFTPQDAPIEDRFSFALMKGRYKLHYYRGYDELNGGELIHLFDVEDDPEELNDLAETRKEIAEAMLAEIKAKLAEANQPYL